MLSPLSLLVGFVIGLAVAGFVLHLGLGSGGRRAQSVVTNAWDLASVARTPRLLVERLDGLHPPAGAQILLPSGTPHVPSAALDACEVRTHPDIHENAVLGDGRALVFTTHPRPGAVAISTTDNALIMRLETTWQRLWKEAEPFAPTVAIADVPSHEGGVVEVRGLDAGMTEYRGRNVLRVEAEGRALPVLVKADPMLTGQQVRIVGRVVREHGLTYLDAAKVAPVASARRN